MNERNEALEAGKDKGTNGFTPFTFGGSVALWIPWFLPCETHFGLLISRIVRKLVYVVSGHDVIIFIGAVGTKAICFFLTRPYAPGVWDYIFLALGRDSVNIC